MYLIINTATGRPMPAGIVPQLARGPDPSTIQFVTSNVAVLLPEGAPLALKFYTMDDVAVPKAIITEWTVNTGFHLYEAVLNALESDLAWTKQKQLLARISYGSPNVDTALFPVGFDSGAVSGEIVQPIIINIGGGGGGGAADFVQAIGAFGGELATEQVEGYWKVKAACQLLGLQLAIQAAPTGAAVIVEVTKNGASTGKTATLAAASKSQETIFGSPLALAIGDIVKFKPTQVGSGTAGTNLAVSGVAKLV